MAAVIRVERLTKTYGSARGVEDVSFEVRAGEVFGFLGPNGAGKTTTIRCLLDVIRPTSGRIDVLGMDPRADAARLHARVGYLPGELGLADRLTARDQARYFANLRGGVDDARIEALAARFQLDLSRRVRELSRGNKQKLGLVQAMMHEPELLILDEPTSGLDPLMQQEFNRLIRETKTAGRTVFLSSHILPEVEALCDRVGIIREGRLVAVEDVATLKARATRHARIRLADAARAGELAGVEGVHDVHIEGETVRCAVRGATGPLVKALATMDVVDLALTDPSLEDVFLGYYSEDVA